MKRFTSLLFMIVLFMPACKAPQERPAPARGTYYFICAEHSAHHFAVRDEFAQCAGFQPVEYDKYFFYQEEQYTKEKGRIPAVAKELRGKLEEKITEFVMDRITQAMGKQLYKHWDFDNMHIPVVFRTFSAFDGEKYPVKVVAVMRKGDFSPRGIIMFLPLEYKMHLLEKGKNE